jgi:glycosyltransferase involved in cell wall biosynthesis
VNITFLHGHLHLGGIETLMLKLSRQFAARGHEVTILVGEGGNVELEAELRRVATLRFFPMSFLRGFPRLSTLRASGLDNADVLFALGGPQLLVATAIQSRFAPGARLVAGVYSPWEYFPARGSIRRDWRLADRVFAAVPHENVIFMNEACRLEHEDATHRSFRASPVIPLPVDIAPLPADRRIDSRKIVSIGRLVEFKPYPFHMLRVISALRRRGVPIEYHVYGDGPERSRLEKAIRDAALSDAVFLHGTIDFSAIPMALADCRGFVGVGTAALDAAALGVPTVVAYESSEPLSLGFFHQTAPSEFGDARSRGPRYSLEEVVHRLLCSNDDEWSELAEAGLSHASRYGSERVVEEYLAAFAGARVFTHRINAVDYAAAISSAAADRVLSALGRSDPSARRYFARLPTPPNASIADT